MENISNPENSIRETKTGKQILVAIDGSAHSTNSLHYLAKLFKNDPSISIHLLSIVTHKMHDTQRAWVDEKNIKSSLDHGSKTLYTKAEHCMDQAKGILMRHGLNGEQIVCNIQMMRGNVVDNLLHEARKGLYDALLIGRRGLGKIQEMVDRKSVV